MLVTGMSEDEILQEIKEDIPNVLALSDVRDNKVRRIVLKSVLFPVYLHSFVTTRRKNNWIILWEAKSKKNVGDNALITFVCYQDTKVGKYAFMPTWESGELILIVYPPHFFQRFAERMNMNLTGIDLIRRYFERNSSYCFNIKREESEGCTYHHIYGSCKEGAAMGLVVPYKRIYLFKTFITYDMCKGKQIEDFAKSEQLRKEIHEKLPY